MDGPPPKKNMHQCRSSRGRPVVAGPIEATALGNILMQALARGQVGSLAEIREIVRNSTDLITYEPGDIGPWDEAYGRFVRLL